jgi:hypothetical protein
MKPLHAFFAGLVSMPIRRRLRRLGCGFTFKPTSSHWDIYMEQKDKLKGRV